ncbi:MAG: hypothetical protein GQ570_13855 [Helicobacteraceae bacterium]|nr:hypothetical protein [Helicobacteraceae bacterium]
MNRRDFLFSSVLLLSTNFFTLEASVYTQKIAILKEPYQTFLTLQDDLFPPTSHLSQINKIGFLKAVMSDSYIPKSEKQFIINGLKWLNDSSKEEYSKNYINLSKYQREHILREISQYRWGENFIYTILNYILEATFSDPIYNANINESGWKWVAHVSGLPRPTRVMI